MASGPLNPEAVLALANSGRPAHLGEIIATTTKNNADTAVAFTIPTYSVVLCQASAACHLIPVSSSAGTVTTSTGVKLGTDEKVTFYLGEYQHVAVVGAATVKVWKMEI